jgi:hypothetical protein
MMMMMIIVVVCPDQGEWFCGEKSSKVFTQQSVLLCWLTFCLSAGDDRAFTCVVVTGLCRNIMLFLPNASGGIIFSLAGMTW